MKLTQLLVLLPVFISSAVHAAPHCKRGSELCNHLQARGVAGEEAFDDLFARKGGSSKASSSKSAPAPAKAKGPAPAPRGAKAAAKAEKKAAAAKAPPRTPKPTGSKGKPLPKTVAHAKAVKDAHPLKPGQLSNRLQATQKGQTARKTMLDAKKTAPNQKAVKNMKKPKPETPGKPKTAAEKKADKKLQGDMSRKINSNIQAKKEQRGKKWEGKKKTDEGKKKTKDAKTARRADRKEKGLPSPPNKAPKNSKPKATAAEKAQVKKAFKDANNKLKTTSNAPGRKDSYAVGDKKFTGKDVRQGIMNSHLYKGHPVGDNPANKNPKPFHNRPYDAGHPDASIAGKRPIQAGQYRGGKEYPIKSKSNNGWTGSGPVGTGRVITYKNKGQKEAVVVGHDPSRGGSDGDHYVAKHTKNAKREIEYELDDLE